MGRHDQSRGTGASREYLYLGTIVMLICGLWGFSALLSSRSALQSEIERDSHPHVRREPQLATADDDDEVLPRPAGPATAMADADPKADNPA